jgi:hypothetical protein
MKGICQPTLGTIATAAGPARRDPQLRVTMRDPDGADNHWGARLTVEPVTGLSAEPVRDGEFDPELDAWMRDHDASMWLSLHDGTTGTAFSISTDEDVALRPLVASRMYRLSVECMENAVDSVLEVSPGRRLDVTVTIDCSGGWGLPIVETGLDRERDATGWRHPPE